MRIVRTPGRESVWAWVGEIARRVRLRQLDDTRGSGVLKAIFALLVFWLAVILILSLSGLSWLHTFGLP